MSQTQTRYRRDRNPEPGPLERAVSAQATLNEALRVRPHAFLEAANAGWSMRQIGEAVGMSPQAVHKIVVAAEEAA